MSIGNIDTNNRNLLARFYDRAKPVNDTWTLEEREEFIKMQIQLNGESSKVFYEELEKKEKQEYEAPLPFPKHIVDALFCWKCANKTFYVKTTHNILQPATQRFTYKSRKLICKQCGRRGTLRDFYIPGIEIIGDAEPRDKPQ